MGQTTPLPRKFTFSDLRQCRQNGRKVAMLTCYDYSTARLMQEAGVPMLLVGDSAAGVILGHPTTLPVSLEFMIELTAAVVRGAPRCMVVADMPFGSYGGAIDRGLGSIFRMVKLSGCDCVKLEADERHAELVSQASATGVAVMAHIGLRPQSVALLGGYRAQGRTAEEAINLLAVARRMEEAGAAALLIEAVPPEVADAIVKSVAIPVIGCGAGSAPQGSVVVTHDALGLTETRPRFVPKLVELSPILRRAFEDYVKQLGDGTYPAPEQTYEMDHRELERFRQALRDGER
jgi:3-methyl-2-oxobutanoate hydroxymethyltransferase